MDGKYLAAISTTVGTIVGGGILGLPYAVSKTGFFPALGLFALLGLASILITMYTGELSSRFKRFHQLPVIVSEYMGKRFRVLVLVIQILTIYGAQIAYLSGIALVFTLLFGLPFQMAVLLIFLLTLPIIYKGYREVENVEVPLLFIKIGLILASAISVLILLNLNNFSHMSTANFLSPFGVVLFSLTGYTVIPEIKAELGGTKKLTEVILVSFAIAIAIYLFFTFAFIGAFGTGVSQVATESIHSFYYDILFAVTTVFLLITPYLALSLVLMDSFSYDFKMDRKLSMLPALLIPLIFALINLNFVYVLELTGGIFISILSVIVLIAVYLARKKEKTKPAYLVPGNGYLILFTAIIMISGLVYTLIEVL